MIESRSAPEAGGQNAPAVRIAELREATVGVLQCSRGFDHTNEAIAKATGERSAMRFGDGVRQEKDLQYEAVVGERSLETDPVVMHLGSDLALERAMSLAEPPIGVGITLE